MAPSLVTSYKTEIAADNAASLVSSSFTPVTGELLVVKAANADADQAFSTPTVSGFTCGAWTSQVNTGSSGAGSRAQVWTAQVTVGGTPGAVTVAVANGATRYHSMVVERWQQGTWQLAGTPAVVSVSADTASPWQESITTAAAGSVVSYVAADWSGTDPAGVSFTGDTATPDQEQAATYASGQYTAYWLTQAAASAGPNTVGLAGPSGINLTTSGLEIQSSGGGPKTVNAGPGLAAGGAYAVVSGGPREVNAGAAQAGAAAPGAAGAVATGWLFAGAAAGSGWEGTSGAVGGTQGDYATWTDSGDGTSAVLEVSSFGAQAAVPSGSVVGDAVVVVRHGEGDQAADVASVTAQAYAGAAPVGDPQSLSVAGAVHEDTVTVTGLSYGDLADLRVRVTATRVSLGVTPAAPAGVTSITRDAAATISFYPGDPGDSPVTSWVVTPYIGGAAQSPQVIPVASAATVTTSAGLTATQVSVTGLSNSTAYTFTVHGVSSVGAGAEAAASGPNTPLAGLVFGDDFGGPAGAQPDPEWWVYQRCGYLAQSEVQWYMRDHCTLDGAGNLKLTAEHVPQTGTTYPSDGNRSITQPWTSGACQSNTRTWYPAAGNTMTYEARMQVCADASSGFWPGLFWLNGQSALTAWKTDPEQGGWNSTDHAEIDIAEWIPGQTSGPDQYKNNTWDGGLTSSVIDSTGLATSMHVYSVQWKPGVRCRFLRDGTETFLATTNVPASGAQMVLLLYLQMLAGGPTATESCLIDYVRVYDQNLG